MHLFNNLVVILLLILMCGFILNKRNASVDSRNLVSQAGFPEYGIAFAMKNSGHRGNQNVTAVQKTGDSKNRTDNILNQNGRNEHNPGEVRNSQGINESLNSTVKLIGHRGAPALMPENTIPGFIAALEHRVDGIEFDIVISADDQIVITHEPWFRHDICLTPDGESISEENQRNYNMYEMTYEEIAKFDCGSLQRPDRPDQQNKPLSKPLMRDAIKAVESYAAENNLPPVIYYVEIKSRPDWDHVWQPEPARVARLVYDELAGLGVLDQSRILAFDVRMLQEMKQIAPGLPQVYLIGGNRPDMAANLRELTYIPEVYAPNFNLVDSALIRDARRQGMRVVTWTVNNPGDMERLINLGVDGIITDYPHYFNRLEIPGRD